MASTTYKTSTLTATFGVPTETGAVIQSVNITSSVEKKTVQDEDGDIVLVAQYGKSQSGSIEFYENGATGLSTQEVAAAVTLSGISVDLAGCTSGTVIVDEVSRSLANQDFAKRTINFSRYPSVVS